MTEPIPSIHREMLIGNIVSLFPEASEIMMGYGIHCAGCHANAYETLEQGLLGHGYPEEHLESLLNDLNQMADEINHPQKVQKKPFKKAQDFQVTVTDFAIEKIQDIARKEGKHSPQLRIAVRRRAGKLSYSLNFIEDSEILSHDQIFPFAAGKIRLIIDQHDMEKLESLSVDYLQEEDREGFKIENLKS